MKTVHVTTGIVINLLSIAIIAFSSPSHAKKNNVKTPDAKPGKLPAQDASATVIARGHDVFLKNCSACHGADAQGDDGPNLHHRSLSDTAITAAVTNGFTGEMPAFGGKLKAPDQQAAIAYVRSLQK